MLEPATLREFRSLIGPENLLLSPEDLMAYGYDATQREALPWAVARPASAQEVSGLVRCANRDRVPLVPRGAGTGMSGGSVPVRGGVVLSFERMNRILEIDGHDFVAVAEPGVITADLQQEAEARGLFYPPDPASAAFCTLGGNVAECAGGLRAVKYGVTRDYVLGLEVVLASGEIVRTGGRTIKSVAGYDLTHLIVGSEGTLGIVTKITLKLLTLPACVRTIAGFYRDDLAAADAAQAVLEAGVLPRALELVDGPALDAVARHLRDDLASEAGAMLLAEADGTEESVARDLNTLRNVMERANPRLLMMAETRQEQDRIWRHRRSISPALYALKPKKLNEDIVVPRSKVGTVLKEIQGIASRRGLLIVNFGHAGDGNIHTNIMFDEGEREQAEAAVDEIFTAVLGLGGSITGEHGIGLTKAAYLQREVGAEALGMMQTIKHALDPNGILNPGKIFFEPGRGHPA